MKRFLLNTASLTLAILLALALTNLVGVRPPATQPVAPAARSTNYTEIRDGDLVHWTLFYEGGGLEAEGTWTGQEGREDGSFLVGEYRSYHRNGTPKDEGSYRNGVREGDWTCSDASGRYTVYATYADGQLLSRSGDVDVASLSNRCQELTHCGGPDTADAEPSFEAELLDEGGLCSDETLYSGVM